MISDIQKVMWAPITHPTHRHNMAEVRPFNPFVLVSAYSCWALPCLLVVQPDTWKACWWSWSQRSAAEPTGSWASSPSSADPGSWFPAHRRMPIGCHHRQTRWETSGNAQQPNSREHEWKSLTHLCLGWELDQVWPTGPKPDKVKKNLVKAPFCQMNTSVFCGHTIRPLQRCCSPSWCLPTHRLTVDEE